MLGFWVVGVVFMALLVLLAIAYIDSLWKQRNRGITSEAAFVVTLSPCRSMGGPLVGG
jgi:hypothetical protein